MLLGALSLFSNWCLKNILSLDLWLRFFFIRCFIPDRLSGLTSLVRSSVVLTMTQWHSVKAGRYGSRLYVWVDGSLSTEAMLAHAYPHTQTNSSIDVGKAFKKLI